MLIDTLRQLSYHNISDNSKSNYDSKTDPLLKIIKNALPKNPKEFRDLLLKTANEGQTQYLFDLRISDLNPVTASCLKLNKRIS